MATSGETHWWVDEGLDPWRCLDDTYLDTPEAWDALAGVIRVAGVAGLDCEFYGLNVRKESCVGRARVHVWSVAIRTRSRSPLGFHRAVGWVLPVAALQHPALKAVLEDVTVEKAVHNQPVDDHAIHNHGVRLAGCVNTLNLARWVWPWFVGGAGFGLKSLMQSMLRRDPICEYNDVVSDVRTIQVTKLKKVAKSVCSCGVAGCRKRKPETVQLLSGGPGIGELKERPALVFHTKSKVTEMIPETKDKEEKYKHPLESILPGHKRWELLVKYAAEDAVAALELLELADKEKDPAPWPYGEKPRTFVDERGQQTTNRPTFNQAVEDCVVLMEREGFPIDTKFAGETAKLAEDDEAKELAWLRKWYRANITEADGELHGYTDEEVDDIWSSPKQLGELFDYFDFPRSPIWKKGKVKPGEMKLDATALKWISRNCPESKQMIGHLLQLKRVRAGKKYLLKLRDSGGWINVICGPAGDADDRNGAVTGRLGIKGTLEAQQLPKKEEVDLYHIRKAIVAVDGRGAGAE